MAGTLLNIKPILAIEDGEVVPVKRVRGAHKAFMEFVKAFEEGSVDRPSLRVGIADADSPERRSALEELVRRTRPQARIEVETTLGAVVGTHAGPGAVGFFWFDEA
jgi:fatty acid-binding protein DegV